MLDGIEMKISSITDYIFVFYFSTELPDNLKALFRPVGKYKATNIKNNN